MWCKNRKEYKMITKRICGLSLPDEISNYIRERAKKEHRSLANIVAMIVIDFYNHEVK